MLNLSESGAGVRLEVKVQPRSSRNQIVGEQNGALKIKLTAPPVEGEANAALIDFLASCLKIPRKDITLIKGDTSRLKLVEIAGIDPDQLLTRLNIKPSF
ncbi:MAG TPA: DUF167 domain-containing protein [Syntrophomonadaceae bacterium]|jgi:uncharacterized protein (TIGR00251 family)|nr:DUF167 domain-containing protein [Syntrophomonadaceae bacterium]HXK57612.1 DUF167 domain-containing protein [Gammaproteobacteria bacterium]